MGLYKSVDKSRSSVHIKTDDEVIVVSGDDKGKRGKVIAVSPREGKVIVDGVNIVSKHVKPRRQGQPGGIIKAPSALYACKVMPYCSRCGKGVRVQNKRDGDKKSVRICAKCKEEL
ncbi:MAG: 50S ribosomal protein L24 [Oscillospiraceae bacterium]|nr:50S ribosomal protein L24 [Oscillospiraceae bacterium]